MQRKLKVTEMGRATLETFRTQTKLPIVLVADNLRSMHNVGALLRTADAFALDSVHLCGITAQPPHPEIHKTALGAEDSVTWHYHNNTTQALKQLHAMSYIIIALEITDQALPLPQLTTWLSTQQPSTPYPPVALIVGNEVRGVSDEALAQCHHATAIPQWGTKHSLNVSVSTGIALWELVRHYQHSYHKND
ncbi:MAG: RNA methyltransferase [Bacteroidales bacterium]|nr:RNA methyltransferase [Bacteroidales bacterium]